MSPGTFAPNRIPFGHIKKFYGASENGVKPRILIAVSGYVLFAIVKKRPNSDASRYNFATDFFAYLIRENAYPAALWGW